MGIAGKHAQAGVSVMADGGAAKLVILVYFFSGLCSLMDEVVWVRLFKLTLGNTVYASSIVVSVFMGSLALGALIMGRYADRIVRRLRLYALLELLASASALSLPWVLRFADGLYRWIFVEYNPSPRVLLLVQVLISAVILLVPTMVMGSTLPLLGRYITALQDRVGRLVGRLYALNMLGAAIGCFLAGFVLIRLAGVMGTLYIAAGINLLVAFAGWLLSCFYDIAAVPSDEVTAAQPYSTVIHQKTGRGRYYLLVLAFFTSGLISIGYELLWMRSIVVLLSGSTYVFSAVLTVYLLGNVLGVWIGSRLSKCLKQPAVGFGASLTFLGLMGVLYIPWLIMWDLKVLANVATLFGRFLVLPGVSRTILPLFHSTILFLLPAIMMGIGFPLALQAWSSYRHKVGQTTGLVYGANTIGAVLGGLVTGFVLIPLIGVQFSIMLLGLVGICLGGIMLQLFTDEAAVGRRVAYLAAAAALIVLAVRVPCRLYERQFAELWNEKTVLLAVEEGITTTVSVHENDEGQLILATSRIPVAGDIKGVFRVPQKILGHLGILLNRKTQNALSVGFGSGETTACMSLHNLQRIDGVEISPELVEVALKFFRHLNLGDRLDEKVNMIYMDAKNYLHLTQNRYDLIVNDCTNPSQFADNASLYTKEYFQSALEHLNPGGIFGTYLPVMEMPISCTLSALGTFLEVFPYVTLWFPLTSPSEYDFWYLAGTAEPQLFSPRYIDEQLQLQAVRSSLSYINLLDSQYVLSCYVGDQNDLKKYLDEFDLNSDFTPYIEFSTDEVEEPLFKKQWFARFFAEVRRDSVFEHIDWTGLCDAEHDLWRQEHALFYKASGYLLESRTEEKVPVLLQNNSEGLKLLPHHAGLLEQQDIYLSNAREALDSGLADDVLGGIEQFLQSQPEIGTAWLIKSWALQRKGRMEAALAAARKAVQYIPDNKRAADNLTELLQKLNPPD